VVLVVAGLALMLAAPALLGLHASTADPVVEPAPGLT
jgi:hypothetical protein